MTDFERGFAAGLKAASDYCNELQLHNTANVILCLEAPVDILTIPVTCTHCGGDLTEEGGCERCDPDPEQAKWERLGGTDGLFWQTYR